MKISVTLLAAMANQWMNRQANAAKPIEILLSKS
jgi:hypothetical protein